MQVRILRHFSKYEILLHVIVFLKKGVKGTGVRDYIHVLDLADGHVAGT